MKLNLLKCVKAFDAIAEIENLDTDFSTAHALVMAKRELEPHVQFFSEKELELAKLYGKRGENGALILDGNRFQIAPESREIYRKKRNGLNLVMVDVTRRTITPPVNVKPSVLEALMEIFDFKEDKP